MAHVTHVIVHADVTEPDAVVRAVMAFESNGYGLHSLTEGDAANAWGGQKNPERTLWVERSRIWTSRRSGAT